ncbi:hypothetical protein [Flavobacterium wongokense]|uniref:hypothetical protein n=1 Tax=Flavobacterium wongokense TaxID=2910674 RepID=UPI001F336A77|nr:hypothetical protein [Flavobacterium sp. WG47]MCF6133019.1 hypothetical protein [Flavobacterium sp. WG47]
MKKIILLLLISVTAFSVNSCSSDDSKSDKATGTISFKINGNLETFTGLHFHETVFFKGTPDEYTAVNIHSDSNEHFNWCQFSYIKGITGGNSIYFNYVNQGDMGYETEDNFTVNVASNGNDNKFIGTFEGDMISPVGTITITEGTFNIQY